MTTPGMQGEVFARIDEKSIMFCGRKFARREIGFSSQYWEPCGAKSAKTLQRKAVGSIERVGIEKSKKEIPGIICV